MWPLPAKSEAVSPTPATTHLCWKKKKTNSCSEASTSGYLLQISFSPCVLILQRTWAVKGKNTTRTPQTKGLALPRQEWTRNKTDQIPYGRMMVLTLQGGEVGSARFGVNDNWDVNLKQDCQWKTDIWTETWRWEGRPWSFQKNISDSRDFLWKRSGALAIVHGVGRSLKRLEALPSHTCFPTPASHLNAAPPAGQSTL